MPSQDADHADASQSPSPVSESVTSQTASAPVRSSGPAPVRRTIPPIAAEDLNDVLNQRAYENFSPEHAIDGQIVELEAWARANLHAERLDSLRYWGMRVLTFLATATAAGAAALGHAELAAEVGVFAAFTVVVDAAWPSLGDRIARRRATHDLRELQHNLKIKWDKVRLAHPHPNAPKRIAHALVLLDQIQAKREEIGRYLGEASPGARTKRR
ncbi:MAG TPA: hypothetical protein VIV60_16665 [Polyangiaceae bacterium]